MCVIFVANDHKLKLVRTFKGKVLSAEYFLSNIIIYANSMHYANSYVIIYANSYAIVYAFPCIGVVKVFCKKLCMIFINSGFDKNYYKY